MKPETYEELRIAVRAIEADQEKGPLQGGITYTEAQKQRRAVLDRVNMIHEFTASHSAKVIAENGKK